MRRFVWGFLGLGLVGLAGGCSESVEEGPRLLATASQMGPVGYRDPAGGISPDGRLIAYTQGRDVVVETLGGEGRQVLGPAPSQVRYVTWLPDSRRLAVHERSFDRRSQRWLVYDVESGASAPLWDRRVPSNGTPATDDLLELSWSAAGDAVVGVVRDGGVSSIWRFEGEGGGGALLATGERLGLPVVSPTNEVACVQREGGVQALRYPCGEVPVDWMEGHQPYGHVAFSPEGDVLYYAAPGDGPALELWSRPVGGGAATRLAFNARDSYGPTVTAEGDVVYKVQDYMVSLAVISPPVEGPLEDSGLLEPTELTSFQSETPSWSPDGSQVAFTFGGWRVATDDVDYPDIDQHIGIIQVGGDLPKAGPDRVVRQSYSEDQGMHWSPNGKWVVYHSHVDGTDDVYLIPENDPTQPRLISVGGHETGWPRWSPDGAWILFPTYTIDDEGGRKSDVYVIAVDQESGETGSQQLVDLGDFPHDALQADWVPDSEHIVFEAAEGPGRKALYRVHRGGGQPTRFHEWESNQLHSGISVSPDGSWVAYIGPGERGFFQVHRVPMGGGDPEQLTGGETQKTQPSYAPDGERLAFTVFRYLARFYQLTM